MKKMYKQPTTDVTALETARLMNGATMSPAGPGGGGNTNGNDAPRRRGDIID